MIVGINLTYYHPVGMNALLGNASKAREQLGWEVNMPFEELNLWQSLIGER
jgi:GDP-D-mannose dehydratase